MKDIQFRFQDLEVWKRGAEISGKLFQLADNLEKRRLFRFAEQLRGATLSITNNIAEGSGSSSDDDFANFLNMSQRSVFEVANILMILSKDNYLHAEEAQPLIGELEEQSRADPLVSFTSHRGTEVVPQHHDGTDRRVTLRMLLAFRRTLKS